MAKKTSSLTSQALLKLFPGTIILSGITLAISLCYGDYKELTHKNLPAAINKNYSLRAEKVAPSYGNGSKYLSQLFGQPPTQSEAKPEASDKNLPDTRLNLVLQGTFTNTQESKASALIFQNNTNSKHYLTGDEVSSGVKLVAVHPGYIILRRNGRDESLKMPILKGERQPSQKAPLTTQTRTAAIPKYLMTNNSYSENIQQRRQGARSKTKTSLEDDGDFD